MTRDTAYSTAVDGPADHDDAPQADKADPSGPPQVDERGRDADRPGEISAKGWKDVARRVKSEAKRDQVPLLSAGVAFYALLALVPALVALVSIYGLVGDPDNLQRQVEDVAGGAPASARQLLTDQLTSITKTAGAGVSVAVVLGVVAALWSASSGMQRVIEAVNVAYNEEESRGFVKVRGMALIFTVGAVIFVVVTLGLVTVLPAVLGDSSLGGAARVTLNLARFPVLALGFMFGLAVIYRYAPDRRRPHWRWTSWGAAIATGVWILGSILFSIYASSFGRFNETYGSLGAVVVLMLWLMLTAFAVVIGAEINAELELQTARDTTEGQDHPMGQREAEVADHLGATS